MRYRVTTVLLNANRGSEQYQSMNSRIACSYVLWEQVDVRLFRTAIFDCSKSPNLAASGLIAEIVSASQKQISPLLRPSSAVTTASSLNHFPGQLPVSGYLSGVLCRSP